MNAPLDLSATPLADPVTGPLSADHRRLDVLLAEAKRQLCAGDIPSARARFAKFREGLERHIAIEEEVLFPALERHSGPVGARPVSVMRAEHAEIRRRMDEVAGALEGDGPPVVTSPLAALTALLYAHNGKEERILYPLSDRALASDDVTGREVTRRLREG